MSFVLVGALQLLLDWATFVALTALDVPPIYANIAGRIAGAMLGFWANGKVTFASERGLGRRQLLRFVMAWTLLTTLSTVLVVMAVDGLGLRYAWIAKPLIEALLSICSFLVAKYWIYR